jgi:hypothetical protein
MDSHVHHVTDRDRDLFTVDHDDELPELVDRSSQSDKNVIRPLYPNEQAQCDERTLVFVTQDRLTITTVEQRAPGFEFVQQDIEQRRWGDGHARLGAHTGRHDVRGSLVREIHTDPDDYGQSLVNGHDLSEESGDLRVPDDQVVRPFERRSYATESHEGRARRKRDAGDHELELVRRDVRSQQDRAQ